MKYSATKALLEKKERVYRKVDYIETKKEEFGFNITELLRLVKANKAVQVRK